MTQVVNVITRHAIRNYGSILQSIATQELIRNVGASARFVDYRQSNVDDTGWSFAARGVAGRHGVLATALYASIRDANVRRMGRVFEAELRASLTMTSRRYRSAEELARSDEFDSSSVYCVGSDQVWNSSTTADGRPYYLEFAPEGARKFSLASSIGLDRLPPHEESALVQALSGFTAVSVREREAVDYLQGLGVHAEHHVDPTLGVPQSFWEDYAGEPRNEAPYLLVYQLNASRLIPDVVRRIATDLNLPVRRIEYWKFYRRRTGGRQIVLPTPREVVQLFRGASFVVTDSFHGAAFSTVFARPFVACPPPRFTSRIESLLALTGCSELLVTSAAAAVELARETPNRAFVEIVLNAERLRLASYIGKAVGEERAQ